jgi:hypothetical protein
MLYDELNKSASVRCKKYFKEVSYREREDHWHAITGKAFLPNYLLGMAMSFDVPDLRIECNGCETRSFSGPPSLRLVFN